MSFRFDRTSALGAVLLSVLLSVSINSTVEAAPTTQSAIDGALARLIDRDPSVREDARSELMGLTPDDLPALRRATESARPLRPGQADVLREIVAHVYLTGENRDPDPDHGFMGVKMRTDFDSVMTGEEDDADQPLGVVVDARVPGFAAYRMLRDGDIILGITLAGLGEQRVHSMYDITGLIGKLAPGNSVRLSVLRGGRHIDVPITLDARPRELATPGQPPVSFERFREELDEKADLYWKANFAPLVDSSIS